jgi:ABC-type branched-subunit amino acid transport system substrate-binding protein
MRRFIDAAIVAISAVAAYPAQAEVLIGVAGPMTGTNAWYGE